MNLLVRKREDNRFPFCLVHEDGEGKETDLRYRFQTEHAARRKAMRLMKPENADRLADRVDACKAKGGE